MDSTFIGLIITVCVIFMAGLVTLVVVGYFKWQEYKHRGIGNNGSRRRRRASTVNSRRRPRRIRVRNTDAATVNNSVQIVLQPPPYSLIDREAPPPYTPYAVQEPAAGRDTISRRPSHCHTPRPLHNLIEQTTEPQQFHASHTTEQQQFRGPHEAEQHQFHGPHTTEQQQFHGSHTTEPHHFTGRHRMTSHTGSTNTPMTTPAGSMFTTSIGGTRDTSASSNMRSVNMVHFMNDVHI